MAVILQNNNRLKAMKEFVLLTDSKKTTLWSALISSHFQKIQALYSNLDFL